MDLARSSQHTICTRCEELDNVLASMDEETIIPETGIPVLSLGKRSRRTNCDLCRFFLDFASDNYKRDYKQHVRLFDRISVSSLESDPSALNALPHSRFLSVLRENSRRRYNYEIQDEIIQSGILVYLPIDLRPLPSPTIRSVNSVNVDFKLLDSLIADCQGFHASCSKVEHRYSLPYIYLIDCTEERVVREDLSQNYLALSYVWGSSYQAKSETAFSNKLPEGSFSFTAASLTVQDAVRVVRSLGRRYLWVDKYCINQKDEADKQMMLRNMDLIYENSEVTIVAMSGEDDDAGLPGVSRQPRTLQPQFRTARGCLISSCPPIANLFQTSKWASRGWTYQEARLSRRCLFFTGYQAYIVCRETTGSEAVPSKSRSCWTSSLLNSSRLDAALFGPHTSIADGFWLDRYIFSQRKLTYESDILDAFRGILSRSPFVSFWGVPITPPKAAMDPHTGFALGLLWTRRPNWADPSHLKSAERRARIRRVNFPTWSWTSVTGEIYNEGYGTQSLFGAYLKGDNDVSIQNDAYIHFHMYVGNKPMPLHQVLRQQNSRILPEESPFLLVQGDIVQFTLTNGKQPYRVQGCEHLPLEFWAAFDLDHDTGADVTQAGGKSTTEDALILVDWNDWQKPQRKRLVLMLLGWIEDGRAERRGLLSEYRKEYDVEALRQIPKTRKTFLLQ